jgi:hypothetical protein
LALPGKPCFYVRNLGFATELAVSFFGGRWKMHTARGIVKLFGRVRQKVYTNHTEIKFKEEMFFI